MMRDLHHEAMNLAEMADLRRGDASGFQRLSVEAMRLERQAAELAPMGMEPTRSVLFRSAASLAVDAGDRAEAQRLATEGLRGNPPADIAAELRTLLKGAN
jgi:hypothetical protein